MMLGELHYHLDGPSGLIATSAIQLAMTVKLARQAIKVETIQGRRTDNGSSAFSFGLLATLENLPSV